MAMICPEDLDEMEERLKSNKGIDPSEEFDTIMKDFYDPLINIRSNLISISSDILEYIKKRRAEKPVDSLNDHFFDSFEKVIGSAELIGEAFSDFEKIMKSNVETIRKEVDKKPEVTE